MYDIGASLLTAIFIVFVMIIAGSITYGVLTLLKSGWLYIKNIGSSKNTKNTKTCRCRRKT